MSLTLRRIVERWMVGYLRRQGWVVFYLEPDHRSCLRGGCWLAVYESGEANRRP